MSILIARIQERVDACGTNLSRASKQTGMGRQYLRDIVTGRVKSPTVEGVAATARVLGCSVAYLIGERNEKNNFPLGETLSDPARAGALTAERDMEMVEVTEAAQEVLDLLHALDKIGDGIGGANGFAVSAVALAARSVADNVYQYFKVRERT